MIRCSQHFRDHVLTVIERAAFYSCKDDKIAWHSSIFHTFTKGVRLVVTSMLFTELLELYLVVCSKSPSYDFGSLSLVY